MDYDQERLGLNHSDPAQRRKALEHLLSGWRAGDLACAPESSALNLHCHTIYSYNGYGHSPTSLAWMARERGWRALGTVDFDVLDAVDECLEACDQVGVRAVAGLETRVYLPEYADREVNSPGEPGVCYFIGMGFVSSAAPEPAAALLADMRRRAAERNRLLVARVNAYLAPVSIDYDRDVLPLTPSANATERHILIAYDMAARRLYPERAALLGFWASKLSLEPAAVGRFMGEVPFPHDAIRSKLMKRGGPGYMQPDAGTFPHLDTVVRAIQACGALPIAGWLDGSSPAESRMPELLELMVARGVAGLNVVPDRNWNIADPIERERKVAELHKVLALAKRMDLPVIVGTEMNKAGQKLVDDFDAEALKPYVEEFVAGADFSYGHTLMQRALGLGYQSAWAREHLPTRRERNGFYTTVGAIATPGTDAVARVASLDARLTPRALLARLRRAFAA